MPMADARQNPWATEGGRATAGEGERRRARRWRREWGRRQCETISNASSRVESSRVESVESRRRSRRESILRFTSFHCIPFHLQYKVVVAGKSWD